MSLDETRVFEQQSNEETKVEKRGHSMVVVRNR
jgi:hypothetical protein